MKKKFFFVLLILLIMPLNIKAKSYEILTYDINININENRVINVKETFNVYFTKESNFVKKFDNTLNITRPNNSKEISKLRISNVSVLVNDVIVDYQFDNNEIIIPYLNDVDDLNKYTISYSYEYSSKNSNELFLDLINNNMDTNISSINFKIEFPKELNKSEIKFLYNSNYDEKNIDYKVENNTIVGSFNKSLQSNETISLYVKLPNNYFKGVSNDYLYLLILVIPLITITLSVINYMKYCKNNKLKIILNSDIPYDYNSAEIAYLYKGYLKEHDLISVLITSANEGYIKFIELDDGYKLGTFNSFKIEKIKDYDKDNAAIKLIFEKLFQNKNLIELKDIEYNLYDTLVEAKSAIDNDDNKEKIFFKNVVKDKKILLTLIIISTVLINFNSIYLYTGKYYFIPIVNILMILGTYILILSNTKLLIKIVFGLPLTLITLYIGIVPIIYNTNLIIYIVGMLLIFISGYVYKIIPYRTKYGNEVLSKIYGFKKALENLDTINVNANYYYDMYPYIYILEMTDTWIKKFNGIITKYPDWYITKEEFSLNNFQKFINNMIFAVTQAMFKRQLTGQSSIHVEYYKDSIKQ